MRRFACVHAHFYQPPRTDPWTGTVKCEPSAAPFHNWNERIANECYGPNAASPVMGPDGSVIERLNNYARSSFNFGPTLLSWLQVNEPETYRAVLAADREGVARFGGHGPALAQAYNHLILPLANERDRKTQVRWGIDDFEFRFGRKPEGMWLPETAVDIPTLEVLSEAGLRFTVLAPGQAARVRPPGQEGWRDVHGDIDPRRAYVQRLPSGRSIALFFYCGDLSHELAFGDVLRNGGRFAEALASRTADAGDEPLLAHVATDGETYGHHHAFGEMALSYAIRCLEEREDVRLTNYGEFLALHPPTWDVQIHEQSSWSCAHGVERWRSDCGCQTGSHDLSHQRWRGPLRHALDWLRDELASVYEERTARIFADPWGARDAAYSVLTDDSYPTLRRFLHEEAPHYLGLLQEQEAHRLILAQKYAMFMYTSCAWFFWDVAGIETQQVLKYAARAIELSRAEHLEAEFMLRLESAKGNQPQFPNARTVYEHCVAGPRASRAA